MLYIATLFLAGMIGHDRVGDRFCSSLLISADYCSLWRDLLAVSRDSKPALRNISYKHDEKPAPADIGSLVDSKDWFNP